MSAFANGDELHITFTVTDDGKGLEPNVRAAVTVSGDTVNCEELNKHMQTGTIDELATKNLRYKPAAIVPGAATVPHKNRISSLYTRATVPHKNRISSLYTRATNEDAEAAAATEKARQPMQPSQRPSAQPTAQPSIQPTAQPSIQPTLQPSTQPTMPASNQPSQLSTKKEDLKNENFFVGGKRSKRKSSKRKSSKKKSSKRSKKGKRSTKHKRRR